jgi:excisionase family DNA binding protein
VLSVNEAADLLGVTQETICAWIGSKRLLAWQAAGRGVVIPAGQILGAGKMVAGIAQVLTVIPDSQAAWDFLSEESGFVDPDKPMRPIEASRRQSRCGGGGSIFVSRSILLTAGRVPLRYRNGRPSQFPGRRGFARSSAVNAAHAMSTHLAIPLLYICLAGGLILIHAQLCLRRIWGMLIVKPYRPATPSFVLWTSDITIIVETDRR